MISGHETVSVLARGIAAGKGKGNAFADLSFALPQASLTAVIGSNGAGKTTLLEALLGIVPLRAGLLQIAGTSPRRARSMAGYVPQANPLVHDHCLTGREFVCAAFRGWRWGVPLDRRLVHAAVDEALCMVGAEKLAEKKLAHLSGGQRKRLLIAQALVNQPKVLVMDEPLAHLDVGAQRSIVDLAVRLRDDHGLSVVVSTHDMMPLVPVTDYVLRIEKGQGEMCSVEEAMESSVWGHLDRAPVYRLRNPRCPLTQPEEEPLRSQMRAAARWQDQGRR